MKLREMLTTAALPPAEHRIPKRLFGNVMRRHIKKGSKGCFINLVKPKKKKKDYIIKFKELG